MGQIAYVFRNFSNIISSFFAQNFCTDRVDILLRSATNEKGVIVEIWHLLPPRSIVGVGDKHAHDSHHAECGKLWWESGVQRAAYTIASRERDKTKQLGLLHFFLTSYPFTKLFKLIA